MRHFKTWLGFAGCLLFALSSSAENAAETNFAFTSPSYSRLLLNRYPTTNLQFFLTLNYQKPGTILDTVGINGAPPGSFALVIDSDGSLLFRVYDKSQNSEGRQPDGWHLLRSTNTLAKGRFYNVAIEVRPNDIRMHINSRLHSRITLKTNLSGQPLFLGDFPGDDNYDPRYNIHPAMVGQVIVVYIGPKRPPAPVPSGASAPATTAPAAPAKAGAPLPEAARSPSLSLGAKAYEIELLAASSGQLDEALQQAGSFPYALRQPVPVTNFPGFPSDDPCNPGNWSLPLVAWTTSHHARVFSQTATASATPANRPPAPALTPEAIEDYQRTVYQSMESMRQLCGATTGELARTFNALWAPFVDQPNAEAYAYFNRLNPLLARYRDLYGQIDGDVNAARQAWQQAGVAAVMPDENGVRAALDAGFMILQRLTRERAEVAALMGEIVALGDPPNPLQAKCRARRSHQAALNALSPPASAVGGAWVMVGADFSNWSSGRIPLTPGTASVFYEKPIKHFAYDYQMLWSHPPGRVAPGDMLELRFQSVRTGLDSSTLICVLDIPRIFRPAFTGVVSKLTQIAYPREDYFSFVMEGSVSTRNEGAQPRLEIRLLPFAGLIRDQLPPLRRDAADWRGERIYRYDWDPTGQRSPYDPGPSAAGAVTGLPEASEAPPHLTSPETAAAIVEHQQTLDIIRRNLQRAADELARETDPKRRGLLEDEVIMNQSNLQEEQDRIDSLKTGTLVHTRTVWEEREHQRFIDNIQQEVYLMGTEARLVKGLPGMASHLETGAFGVRQQIFKDMASIYNSGLSLEERVARLRQVGDGIQAKARTGQTQAFQKLRTAEDNLWYAEKIQTAATVGIMAGALLVPGAGNVAIIYGFGTGWAEGGPSKAAENTVRALNPAIDVAWAGYDGYYAQEPDPATGMLRYRGWQGAAENAATTYVLNKVFEKVGNYAQGHPPADLPGMSQTGAKKGSASAGREAVAAEPRIDAFEDNVSRYRNELAKANRRYEGFYPKDPAGKIDTRHPNYEKVKSMQESAIAQVRDNNGVIARREDLKAELAAATRNHEARIPADARTADGGLDTKHAEYQRVKSEWEADLASIRKKHNQDFEKRWNEQKDVLENAGLYTEDKKALLAKGGINAVELSGGMPKSIMSDIDLTARDMKSGLAFIDAMKGKGYKVLEFSDRWIIPRTDTTLWKPNARPETVGSSAHASSVDYYTSRGSDKFPTEGGVSYATRNAEGIEDPAGAVISNLKKATEAGIGGTTADPDYHIIGKSCDKAAEVANKYDPSRPLQDPAFFKKAQSVRDHNTPEEAGILTFGNTPAAKAGESQQFLSRAQGHIRTAMKSGEAASLQMNANNLKLMTACEVAGDRKTANRIRELMVRARVSNEAAMASLSRQDPALIAHVHADLCSVPLPPLPPPPPDRVFGYGWLLASAKKQMAAPPPAVPASARPLPETMKAAAQTIEKGALPALKGNSPESAYLQSLKASFEAGVQNPVYAARAIRAASGYEMTKVASDLAGVAAPSKGKGGGSRIANPLAPPPSFSNAPPLENRELGAMKAVWVFQGIPVRVEEIFPIGFSNTGHSMKDDESLVSIVPSNEIRWAGGSLEARVPYAEPNYHSEKVVKLAAAPKGEKLTVVQTEGNSQSRHEEAWDLCRLHDLPLAEKKTFGGNPRFTAWIYRAGGRDLQPLVDAFEFGTNMNWEEDGRGKRLLRAIRWEEAAKPPRFTVIFGSFHPSQFDELLRKGVMTAAQRQEFETWITRQSGS